MKKHPGDKGSLLLCLIAALCILFSPAAVLRAECAASVQGYDVVVAGGGIGGTAAAIQAARMGASVLVVEPSGWIGGQATAAGVSTMDDLSRLRSGIYLEFISRMQSYYDQYNKPMGTCYWDPRSIAFEPSVGQRTLYEMLDDARQKGGKKLEVMLHTTVTGVTFDEKDSTTIRGAVLKNSSGEFGVKCRVLIDATEYGDILPLAKVPYRAGNSATPFLNNDAMIQDITWVAVIRSYPGDVPADLRPTSPLPGYAEARRNYESYVTANGMDFKGIYPVKLPVNFISHNAYRGLPDSSIPWRNYDGTPDNWKYITKCGVNWGNDYPGKAGWDGRKGLPVSYLEDRGLRTQIEKDALIKTLHFIYYMQHELGKNWSVTDDEYMNEELPEAARDLPPEWQTVARRMPPIPYVRESRRMVGEHILTSEELLHNSLSYRDGQTSHEFSDAIAIGGYILDLHGADSDSDMEWDLGEKSNSVQLNRPRGPFQVPLHILIPGDVEGFLAAEKNLSMTRLAAGAIRLQPICMMVGQAAGALAARSVLDGVALRDVPPVKVQRALLEGGVVLSLCKYSDVPPEHRFYNAVQLSNLYGLMAPLEPPHAPSYNISDLDDPVLAMAIIKGADKGVLGVDEMVTHQEMVDMINKARVAARTGRGGGLKITEKPDSFVSRGVFAQTLVSAFGFDELKGGDALSVKIAESHRYAEAVKKLDSLGILDLYRGQDFLPAHPLTRGEAAEILMRAMTVDQTSDDK